MADRPTQLDTVIRESQSPDAAFADAPALLAALAAETAARPLDRKLLVGRSPAESRELLHALAHAGVAWIGWEPVSLRQLALDLAAPALATAGLGLADDFEVTRLLDEALDAVAARGGAGARTLAAPGFRGAAHRAVVSLRAAGVGPGALRAAAAGDAERLLAGVLEAYTSGLAAARLVDGAGVLAMAADALEANAAALPAGRVVLAPGLERSGLQVRLLDALIAHDAVILPPADAVVGMEAPRTMLWREAAPQARLSWLHAPERAPKGVDTPQIALFAAATPADELREVLRRVLAAGVPWDAVEIVASDAFTYGPTLDALAQRLDVPVTHAAGLSSQRTRAGRAVAGYFAWVTEGFPAERLRALLEAGDLAPPEAFSTSGPALATRLRRLQVGWGRERYLPAIDHALEALAHAAVPEDVDAEEWAARCERERTQLQALRAMLAPVLAATPAAPDRLRTRAVRTSPAALAVGLLAFLDLVPAGGKVENTTRGEIRRRLERARETLTRETGWDAAAAALRARLELQVAAESNGGAAGWTSTGGSLHFSDLRTGGLTGRPYSFVVGLDATRTASAGATDPLLSDVLRRRLNTAAGAVLLPTSADRLAAGRHAVAALLARLRGAVTLSYSAWDAAEGRAVSPAAELLQALRLRERDRALVYDHLHREVGALACAVPADATCLDATDVWMRALAGDRVLRTGQATVREAFAGLGAGVRAAEARAGEQLTEHHGCVDADTVRPVIEAMRFSPSRLETLGACPRQFFYRYVLRLRPPEVAEWDAEHWLDALSRGTLLHSVYEHTLKEAREEGVALDDEPALRTLALAVLAREAAAMRRQVPPPSERVYEQELAALAADTAIFATMIAEVPPRWVELEWEFGQPGREVSIEVGGVRVALQGKIDRVDETAPGTYRVVDYKSGSPRRYREAQPFGGGRRIQHWLYQLAAEQALGARRTTMEYHFPTVNGEKRAVAYPPERLARGGDALAALLELAVNGRFVATDDPADCTYCDYAQVCRAQPGRFGGASCDAAEWSGKVGMNLNEYAPLKVLRGIDGDS